MSADNDFQPIQKLDQLGLPVQPPPSAPRYLILAGCLICAAISVPVAVLYTRWNRHTLATDKPSAPTLIASGLIGVLPFVFSLIANRKGWKIKSGRLRLIIALISLIAGAAGTMLLLNAADVVTHCTGAPGTWCAPGSGG